MAGAGIWFVSWMLGGAVFVPLLVISLVQLRSVKLAFAVAIAFSIGAMLGFFLSASLAVWLRFDEDLEIFVFASVGAIGGAALALSMLRHFARNHDWRR